jgi:hypothetical protein
MFHCLLDAPEARPIIDANAAVSAWMRRVRAATDTPANAV